MCCHEHPDNGSDLAVQTQEQITVTEAEGLLKALEEIEKGEGAYNRDQLTHATNTIDNMKRIAHDAIEKVKGKEHNND